MIKYKKSSGYSFYLPNIKNNLIYQLSKIDNNNGTKSSYLNC